MRFADVVGQEALKIQLVGTVTENRVSHAQLFAGSEGSGGLPLALAYAQYISCEQRTAVDSCGTCKSCVKYEKYIHPDLHFVFPVINTKSIPKAFSDDYLTQWRVAIIENPYLNLNHWIERIAENQQGGIFERESIEIIRKLSLKSYESEFKVMVIWMPEKMNPTTANKLLKLIEEPPQKTLFLLVSENPAQLLPTILSRCQYIKVPPIMASDMQQHLVRVAPQGVALDEIVRVAAGNYYKVMELLRSGDDNSQYLKYFILLMRLSYQQLVLELITWSEEMASIGREKQKKFLLISLRLVRENFALNMAGNDLVYMDDQELEFSQKFSPFINENNVFHLNTEFNKALYHIESNGNPKIVFLDLGLQIIQLIRK